MLKFNYSIRKTSINRFDSTIQNQMQSYKTTLQNFLIKLPKSHFPSITYEELLQATNKNQLEHINIAHQQERYYRRIIEDNPFQNLNTVTTQTFYPILYII